jgi:hypothetical protein
MLPQLSVICIPPFSILEVFPELSRIIKPPFDVADIVEFPI